MPGEQDRDWRQRWQQIQSHLTRILTSRTETMSASAIHAALHELQSFFVQAYHLKDALKHDAVALGITEKQVEDGVSADTYLSLLADLANLDKHSELTRRPRSGAVPDTAGVSGRSLPGGGWQLSWRFEHMGSTLDGVTVAAEIVPAWESLLRDWGLI